MKKTVMEFRNQKTELHRILAYSIVMGIAINIISGSLGKVFNLPLWLNLIIWISISLLIIVVSQIVDLYKLNSTIEFDGLLITDENDNNKLIGIPNYQISTDMKLYFDAAFSENPAYKTTWENNGLDKLKDIHVGKTTNDSQKLLIEMIEYCILDHYSTFVDDYYNSRDLNEKTVSYSGKETPDVLLNNRFLKLFSEEPQNRAAFCTNLSAGVYSIDDSDATVEANRTLVYMTVNNGAMFRRFSLTVPKGSKVFRDNANRIVIDTKLFEMKYKVAFDGFSTYVDRDFDRYYLHTSKDEELHDWKFEVKVNVKYKISALIKPWDWRYYNWLDEYIEKLSNYCAIETFYQRIGWEGAKTLIQLLKSPKILQ